MSADRVGVPDREAEQDLLDIQAYIDGCAEFIRSCRTPMSIAVQGDWGSGKSSFMSMVRNKLEENNWAICINFNTWQYSRLTDDWLFLPMLMHLEAEIDRLYEERDPETYKTTYRICFRSDEKKAAGLARAKKVFKVMQSSGSGGWDSLIGGAGVMVTDLLDKDGTDSTVMQKDRNLYEYATEALKIRDGLQDKIDVLIGRKTFTLTDGKIGLKETEDVPVGRIVILVDDLDRLKPDTAVNLLEDMKNFIDIENCVFVLAMDNHLVERGVEAKYGKSLGPEYARKFFEKIVQIPFYMPVSKYRIGRYIEELLRECGAEDLGKEEAMEAAEIFTGGNPREIKRAVNAYQMQKCIHPGETHGLRTFVLLLLQMRAEELFRDTVLALRNAPASERFEEDRKNESFEAFMNSRTKETEKEILHYVLDVFDSDADSLKQALFRQTAADTENFGGMRLERDEVFYLLCSYLKEKGFEERPLKNGAEFGSGNNVFRVTRYDSANHTTLSFTGGTKQVNKMVTDLTAPYIAELTKSGCLAEKKSGEEEESYTISGSENSVLVRIRKPENHALFVRRVTVNPQVLHLIGKITNLLLKGETK